MVKSKIPKPSGKKKIKKKSADDLEEEALKQQQKDSFELVRLRNHFYRDSYRRLVVVMVVMLVTLGFSLATVFYLVSHRPKPKYFATNIYGGIVPLKPLSEPSLNDQELLQWASRAVIRSLSFNYVEYQGQLQATVNTYFTPYGGKQYLQALQDSLNLGTVVNNKYIQVAEATSAPTIKRQPSGDGASTQPWFWDVEMNVKLTFHGCDGTRRVYQQVNLTIVRSSYFVENKADNIDQTKGVGINQFLMRKSNQKDAYRTGSVTGA